MSFGLRQIMDSWGRHASSSGRDVQDHGSGIPNFVASFIERDREGSREAEKMRNREKREIREKRWHADATAWWGDAVSASRSDGVMKRGGENAAAGDGGLQRSGLPFAHSPLYRQPPPPRQYKLAGECTTSLWLEHRKTLIVKPT